MKKKLSMLAIALLAAVLVLTGCNSGQPGGKAVGAENGQSGEMEKGTLTIKHELGETIVDENPERIVVFDYAILESLDTLGFDVIGLAKSNIPPSLAKFKDYKYANIGSLQEPDFEKIYELDPDVILISSRQQTHYDALSEIAPTIFFNTMPSDYLEGFQQNMAILGELLDVEDKIKVEVEKIVDAAETLTEEVKASGANALVVLTNDGSISAYGPGSRFGVIHDNFGFAPVDENILVTNHGESITFEYILEKNPDYLFVVDRGAVTGGEGSTSASRMLDNEIIKQTNAYKNGNIVYLDSYLWYVASGGFTGTKTMIEEVETGFNS